MRDFFVYRDCDFIHSSASSVITQLPADGCFRVKAQEKESREWDFNAFTLCSEFFSNYTSVT